MLRRITITVALGTMVALIGLIAVANPAYAKTFNAQNTSTTGAKATCSLQTRATRIHDDTAQIDCQLSDTKADSHSVYVEWWQDGFGHIQLRNSKGAGHTIHVADARTNYDGSFETAYFKVCRDVQFLPDNCSGTKSWRIS